MNKSIYQINVGTVHLRSRFLRFRRASLSWRRPYAGVQHIPGTLFHSEMFGGTLFEIFPMQHVSEYWVCRTSYAAYFTGYAHMQHVSGYAASFTVSGYDR
jgi:hypothetical protein